MTAKSFSSRENSFEPPKPHKEKSQHPWEAMPLTSQPARVELAKGNHEDGGPWGGCDFFLMGMN